MISDITETITNEMTMLTQERDELYIRMVVEARMNEFAAKGMTASWSATKLQVCRDVLTALEQGRWPGLLLDPTFDFEADDDGE